MIHENIELTGSFNVNGTLIIPTHASASSALSTTGSIYNDSTDNVVKLYTGTEWIVVGAQTGPSVSIQYLVVAGGGGGGFNWGGGGGAGGVLTGSLSSIESNVSIGLTIGAGGGSFTNGQNSTLTLDSVSTLTAVGGGRGGARTSTTSGAAGGSGGGGCYSGGSGGAGTNGQGFAGAAGPVWSQYGGGGGGGASETPLRPQGNSAVSTPPEGSGGAGIEWPVGSGNKYAGGGGASHQGNETIYTVPWGGGGLDATLTNVNGIANTGGGGSGTYTGTGGSGGSGIVILKVLTSKYSGTTTGSPTVTTDGDYTIIKFTSSGTYTS
jgi:hypothetical protein